jgi:hypothetical protein
MSPSGDGRAVPGYERDRYMFEDAIDRCLGDIRIVHYFQRRLADREEVRESLIRGDTFEQAMALTSYHEYTGLVERIRNSEYQAKSRSLIVRLRSLISRASGITAALARTGNVESLRQTWLADSVEKVIIPNATLEINTRLGNDQDKLLVEQDSQGLKRLQDPTFRVPTKTQERLTNLLSQMDGGSIAVAGPRGAGKSTLLKQFGPLLNDDITSSRTIAIYVSAPSNYVARDFIAEFFQRLCEAYLSYCEYPTSEELYRIGSSRIKKQKTIRKISRISWLTIRAAIATALILLVAWMIFTIYHISRLLRSFNISSQAHYLDSQIGNWANGWWPGFRTYLLLGIVLTAVWLVWPPRALWRTNLRRTPEPELSKRAREYLLRLRVDKTVTRGAGVTSPGLKGLALSVNRASSAKYTPWSLPELVGYTRRFMEDISSQMKALARSSSPVVVAIDEIDRIGSLEDAEGFIGEIKAVFGVEGCYFLVAVADDVGSLFAQRATAGRSILENAFDEIVSVGHLTLQEARSLLLKRVPGFTDAFVYLVYAMSGGLPRELIRVTRRLIEMNLEQRSEEYYPRLEDLALSLVTESMIDALEASRNQMSRLILGPEWAEFFTGMRSAATTLRSVRPEPGRSLAERRYQVFKDISTVNLPDTAKDGQFKSAKTQENEEAATQILNSLSAFAYFGATVVDAFSDKRFNLADVRQRTKSEAGHAYEELASARLELSMSHSSARLILDRFQSSLHSAGP